MIMQVMMVKMEKIEVLDVVEEEDVVEEIIIMKNLKMKMVNEDPLVLVIVIIEEVTVRRDLAN